MKQVASRGVASVRRPAGDLPLDDPPEARTRPLDWDLVAWLAGFTRPHARRRNVLLVAVLLRSVQLPLLAWSVGQIINGPITNRSAAGLMWGVAGFLALAAATQITLHFRQRLALELGEAVVHDLRTAIFEHLQQMRMEFFQRWRLGRIISRTTSDVEAVRVGVQDVVFVGLVNAGQMLVAAGMLFWCDAALFALLAAMTPGLWLLNRIFRRRLSQVHREVQESFSRVTSSIAEAVNGVRVTQSFVRQQTNAERFADLVADHSRYNLKAARTSGLFLPLLELNSQLFLALLLIVGGYRVLHPGALMSVGDLIQFFLLANLLFQPLQTLGDLYNQALTAMAGAERVRELLNTPPTWDDPPNAIALPKLAGHVVFEQVDFAYEPDRPVLKQVSFEARPGQSIALVGHTGSGKSTIINLIAKFYLPSAGRLLIDGHDVRTIDTDALHRQMGLVLQQNFLFTGSVLDNIRLGNPTASDEQVRAAVEALDCLDLLLALPDGLHTPVGERGVGLSLGQRQVVCFARAMLADPRILLLDEATSSVDMITEARIQRALQRLLAGRTSFVVAHRLSTIRHADCVLVLDQGRIVERGRHAELLAADGAYARLHRQFTGSSGAAVAGVAAAPDV